MAVMTGLIPLRIVAGRVTSTAIHLRTMLSTGFGPCPDTGRGPQGENQYQAEKDGQPALHGSVACEYGTGAVAVEGDDIEVVLAPSRDFHAG